MTRAGANTEVLVTPDYQQVTRTQHSIGFQKHDFEPAKAMLSSCKCYALRM